MVLSQPTTQPLYCPPNQTSPISVQRQCAEGPVNMSAAINLVPTPRTELNLVPIPRTGLVTDPERHGMGDQWADVAEVPLLILGFFRRPYRCSL